MRRHYRTVVGALAGLDTQIPAPASRPDLYPCLPDDARRELDPGRPIAVLLVGGYGGLGRHALLTLLRMFPGHFQGVVFVSVAVVDSDVFKGAERDPGARGAHAPSLAEYERFATALGLPATSAYAVGTEVAVEAEQLAVGLVQWYPKVVVVAGQIIFAEDTMWNRMLHNQTALVIQRRLQQRGRADDRDAGRAGPGRRAVPTRAGRVPGRPPARGGDRPLPNRRAADRAHDAVMTAGATMDAAVSPPGPLVLVVEDEPQMRRFLRASLTSHGYQFCEASSAAEAVALATSRGPEMVLLDLGLPDEDGVDLTRRLARMVARADHRDLRARA